MKKEKLALTVFWLVLLALVVNWRGCIAKFNEEKQKQEFTSDILRASYKKFHETIDAARLKGENLTAEDYHRDMLSLLKLEMGLSNNYTIPTTIDIDFKKKYGNMFCKPLVERLQKGNKPDAMMFAQTKVWQEAGYKGVIDDSDVVRGMKKFFLWLLKVWFVGLLLIPFLYTYRCWLMKKSLKELVFLQPLNFFGHVVFWFIGLMVEYPKNTIDVAHKYYQIKSNYMHEIGKRHLTEEEEMMLWQKARGRIEKFDRSVAKAVQYSKFFAFATSLFIFLFMPKKGFATEKKEVAPITKTVSGFAQLRYKPEIGFFVPVTVFTLKGKILEVDYRIEINPAALKFDENEIVRDVWVKFRLFGTNICAGRQFMFFTSTPAPDKWWLVEYPKPVNKIASIYDTGIVADVSVGWFKYRFGVVNGSGSEASDSNEAKDFYGKLTFSPTKEFSAGFACQTGKQPDGYREKYCAHMILDLSGAEVISEYYFQKQSNTKQHGWFVSALWKIENFQFVTQFDSYTAETKEDGLTLGLNYLPAENLMLKLNARLKKHQHPEILGCLQFSF